MKKCVGKDLNIQFDYNKENDVATYEREREVSAGDFKTLGVEVAQSTADLATVNTQIAVSTVKPTIADVNSQIDAKNIAQGLQINLDYAHKATTHNASQVDGLLNARTTTTDVQGLMSTRFLAQDMQNFMTYHDGATGLTAAIAAAKTHRHRCLI